MRNDSFLLLVASIGILLVQSSVASPQDSADFLVVLAAPPENLELAIEPDSGEAVIRNLSALEFDVSGYLVTSASGALSYENWLSFHSSGLAGPGWVTANCPCITELNTTGSQFFDRGKLIPIGPIFIPGGPQDVEFEFVTRDDELHQGTVEYGPLWECNEDGLINIFDANCTPHAELDTLLDTLGSLRGDFDGDGVVQFGDFLVLADNFAAAGEYTGGDIDKDGIVHFSDFLILSENFGKSFSTVARVVPEPRSSALTGLWWVALILMSQRRFQMEDAAARSFKRSTLIA